MAQRIKYKKYKNRQEMYNNLSNLTMGELDIIWTEARKCKYPIIEVMKIQNRVYSRKFISLLKNNGNQ